MIRIWSKSTFNSPIKGLEYNKLSSTRKVSRGLYRVDFARMPNLVRDDFQRVDVLKKAELINSENDRIFYREALIKGRII